VLPDVHEVVPGHMNRCGSSVAGAGQGTHHQVPHAGGRGLRFLRRGSGGAGGRSRRRRPWASARGAGDPEGLVEGNCRRAPHRRGRDTIESISRSPGVRQAGEGRVAADCLQNVLRAGDVSLTSLDPTAMISSTLPTPRRRRSSPGSRAYRAAQEDPHDIEARTHIQGAHQNLETRSASPSTSTASWSNAAGQELDSNAARHPTGHVARQRAERSRWRRPRSGRGRAVDGGRASSS